jgi:hypothetical protein
VNATGGLRCRTVDSLISASGKRLPNIGDYQDAMARVKEKAFAVDISAWNLLLLQDFPDLKADLQ